MPCLATSRAVLLGMHRNKTQPVENVGIRQMTVLLNAGYPLEPNLQLAIGELVSAAARAARTGRGWLKWDAINRKWVKL